MNTTDLIQDARLMLETIEQCNSPAFRAAAARQLTDIAAQLQSASSLPDPSEPEPEEEPPAMIDLAFKYRTRDGREVTELQIRGNTGYPIWGVVEGGERNWTKEGFFVSADNEHSCDLIPTGELA